MPLEVKKQERETSQNLIRRFSKRIKKSGILKNAKKNRFTIRKKSKQLKKRSALRREEKRIKLEKLEKLGKRQ